MSKQRRNNRSKFNRQRTGTGAFFSQTFITGGNFYGVKVGNSIDDFLNFDQRTSSTPNVIISGNSAVLDFTASQTKKDLNYLKALSDTLVSGNTFTIINGGYYDPNTEIYADISGTYTFEGMFRDTVISATFDTLTNIPTGVLRYSSDYFSDVPQIDLLGTAGTGREKFTIKNYLGNESSPSLTSMGARVNDYVTISDSVTNNKAFRVDDFYLDPNGTEVLILGATAAIEEDRIGVTSEIKLYRNTTPVSSLSGNANLPGVHDRDQFLRIETLKITVGVDNNDNYYYMINGIKSPRLTLTRGITYIIDQTDPSNYRGPNGINLPFRLSYVREGTFNRSAAAGVTDGIFVGTGVVYPKTEANFFIFEPRFLKDSIIYFYCGTRNGMGGEFSIDGVYSIPSERLHGFVAVPPQYRTSSNFEYARDYPETANRMSEEQLTSNRTTQRPGVFDRSQNVSYEVDYGIGSTDY